MFHVFFLVSLREGLKETMKSGQTPQIASRKMFSRSFLNFSIVSGNHQQKLGQSLWFYPQIMDDKCDPGYSSGGFQEIRINSHFLAVSVT